MISDDDFGSILDELLALYPTMATLELREAHMNAAHLAHGWYQRVRRSCEAIVALERLGYDPEAAPIRRTIIEHTVALKWLAEEGDGVLDVMALEHAARAKRIMKATKAANWTSVDQNEIQTVIDEIDEDSRDYTKAEFKHFSKQNQDQSVLAVYLAEVGRPTPLTSPPSTMRTWSRGLSWTSRARRLTTSRWPPTSCWRPRVVPFDV